MEKIIKIQPIDNVFSLTWNVGPRCNYDCMYCPTKWHDKVTPHYTLLQLQDQWQRIFERSKNRGLLYKIVITGGEVTGNKDFIPFVQWLRDNYNQYIFKILMTTNGSATEKYYTKLFSLIDNISFSVHSEHIDENKFFKTLISIKIPAGKHIHVNIMDEFWNQDRIELYKSILNENQISFNINKIDYAQGTRTYPIIKGKLNLAES
jgi:MoaA/NifB/PqqE/SkfB family radical SAM enzyme